MASTKSRYWARVAAGLCTYCDAQATPGQRNCEACRRERRQVERAQRASLVERGVCIECRDAPPDRGVRCSPCADYNNARTKAARALKSAASG